MKIYKNLDINNLENEIWKVIEDVPDYYVSSLGRIKSFKRDKINGKILNQNKINGEYFQVKLFKNGKKENKLIHRLVYETFKGKIEEGCDAHHINEDKEDNCAENLESKPHSEHSRDHNKGKIISEEIKMKMSGVRKEKFKNGELNQKGKNAPNFGKYKLKDEEVWLIKKILDSDYYKSGKINQTFIGKMFGVKRTTISNIKLKISNK